MPAIQGFAWLLGFWLLGETLVHVTGVPVSAGVIGMLALCLMAHLGGSMPASIRQAATPLIALLAMLIMPGVVGVFFIVDELAGAWGAILASLILGTLLSVATTLWLMQTLIRRHDAQ